MAGQSSIEQLAQKVALLARRLPGSSDWTRKWLADIARRIANTSLPVDQQAAIAELRQKLPVIQRELGYESEVADAEVEAARQDPATYSRWDTSVYSQGAARADKAGEEHALTIVQDVAALLGEVGD